MEKFGEKKSNGEYLVAVKTVDGKVIEEYTEPRLTPAQRENIEERKKFTSNKKHMKRMSTVTKDACTSVLRMRIERLSNSDRSFLLHVSVSMTEDNHIYFNQKESKGKTIMENITSKMGITLKTARNILYGLPDDIIRNTHSGISGEYIINTQAFTKSGVNEQSLLELHDKIAKQPTTESFMSRKIDMKKDWLRTGTIKNNYADSANRVDENGKFTIPEIG